jgi:hypothetical protein
MRISRDPNKKKKSMPYPTPILQLTRACQKKNQCRVQHPFSSSRAQAKKKINAVSHTHLLAARTNARKKNQSRIPLCMRTAAEIFLVSTNNPAKDGLEIYPNMPMPYPTPIGQKFVEYNRPLRRLTLGDSSGDSATATVGTPLLLLAPSETGHRLNLSGGQGRRRQGVILHHQIRSRSPPARQRWRGRALLGGRDREKKGDANWKTVAKSEPDPRRCSASVGGPPAPEATTARGGLHRPGDLLCIAHHLRADPCRGSRWRRQDLRLGRTSAGADCGGGGVVDIMV